MDVILGLANFEVGLTKHREQKGLDKRSGSS